MLYQPVVLMGIFAGSALFHMVPVLRDAVTHINVLLEVVALVVSLGIATGLGGSYIATVLVYEVAVIVSNLMYASSMLLSQALQDQYTT